uniref:Carboxypeptidase Q n=1 Tax=Knipowitschia caucasica TaxID=637954 RepID=A0AAV2MFL4_KNICA
MITDCVELFPMDPRKHVCVLFFIFTFFYIGSNVGSCHPHNSTHGKDRAAEVAAYADVAKRIIDLAVNGAAQNRSYRRLADFTDAIGNRVSGSKNLENAINYMHKAMALDGLEVHLEPVKVPHWVRGKESAEMLQPRPKPLAMLGLGSSVGTPPGGIRAEVVVVRSFTELKSRGADVKGKIVVYNQPFVSYGETVAYRAFGASEAAKLGAVAALIRSITPFSINSPHTGVQDYQDGVVKIPAACITVEDAELMWRMSQRGEHIEVLLNMGATTLPDADSFNTVAEIRGWQHPEQVVLLSGHLDSWDVGQGAMDDGGGAMISWEALSLIQDLGLRPRRTLRTVLWTGEEQGGVGAQQYYNLHKVNLSDFDLVMESDLGTFKPVGLQFTGSEAAQKVMEQVVQLLAPINTTKLEPHGEGTDISPWMEAGVPGASLHVADSKYFWFHHTEGDTLTVQDPHHMDLCSALWAVVAFVVGDLEEMLPRAQVQDPQVQDPQSTGTGPTGKGPSEHRYRTLRAQVQDPQVQDPQSTGTGPSEHRYRTHRYRTHRYRTLRAQVQDPQVQDPQSTGTGPTGTGPSEHRYRTLRAQVQDPQSTGTGPTGTGPSEHRYRTHRYRTHRYRTHRYRTLRAQVQDPQVQDPQSTGTGPTGTGPSEHRYRTHRYRTHRYRTLRAQVQDPQVQDPQSTGTGPTGTVPSEHRYRTLRAQVQDPQVQDPQSTGTGPTGTGPSEHRYRTHRYRTLRAQVQDPQVQDPQSTGTGPSEHRYRTHRYRTLKAQVQDPQSTGTGPTGTGPSEHRYRTLRAQVQTHRYRTLRAQVQDPQVQDPQVQDPQSTGTGPTGTGPSEHRYRPTEGFLRLSVCSTESFRHTANMCEFCFDGGAKAGNRDKEKLEIPDKCIVHKPG